MIYLNVLGKRLLILNSLEVITDLLEKRSSNYSDRKQSTMLSELYVTHLFTSKKLIKNAIRCRMNFIISMSKIPYGSWWRRHRRLFHEHFHRNAVTKYQPIQRQEVRAFLRRLLVTPDNFLHHIRQYASCLIFECA
jgi:cytochrome P450